LEFGTQRRTRLFLGTEEAMHIFWMPERRNTCRRRALAGYSSREGSSLKKKKKGGKETRPFPHAARRKRRRRTERKFPEFRQKPQNAYQDRENKEKEGRRKNPELNIPTGPCRPKDVGGNLHRRRAFYRMSPNDCRFGAKKNERALKCQVGLAMLLRSKDTERCYTALTQRIVWFRARAQGERKGKKKMTEERHVRG